MDIRVWDREVARRGIQRDCFDERERRHLAWPVLEWAVRSLRRDVVDLEIRDKGPEQAETARQVIVDDGNKQALEGAVWFCLETPAAVCAVIFPDDDYRFWQVHIFNSPFLIGEHSFCETVLVPVAGMAETPDRIFVEVGNESRQVWIACPLPA